MKKNKFQPGDPVYFKSDGDIIQGVVNSCGKITNENASFDFVYVVRVDYPGMKKEGGTPTYVKLDEDELHKNKRDF